MLAMTYTHLFLISHYWNILLIENNLTQLKGLSCLTDNIKIHFYYFSNLIPISNSNSKPIFKNITVPHFPYHKIATNVLPALRRPAKTQQQKFSKSLGQQHQLAVTDTVSNSNPQNSTLILVLQQLITLKTISKNDLQLHAFLHKPVT